MRPLLPEKLESLAKWEQADIDQAGDWMLQMRHWPATLEAKLHWLVGLFDEETGLGWDAEAVLVFLILNANHKDGVKAHGGKTRPMKSRTRSAPAAVEDPAAEDPEDDADEQI